MKKAMLLLMCGAAAVFSLLLSRPSPSVELDAGQLDGSVEDEWYEGDAGADEEDDAGVEALFDGGLDPWIEAGPDPIPLPDDDPIPVPPGPLAPPVQLDDEPR